MASVHGGPTIIGRFLTKLGTFGVELSHVRSSDRYSVSDQGFDHRKESADSTRQLVGPLPILVSPCCRCLPDRPAGVARKDELDGLYGF